MSPTPHPDRQPRVVHYAVMTVSDTRTVETDHSGHLIQELLNAAGHHRVDYCILPDDPTVIRAMLQQWQGRSPLEAILINGGTGIAPRDTTYDAVEQLLDKTLPGFGELFRWLSYQDIGSRAMASRAVAGVTQGKLLFSLPGSSNAVRLAVEKLILPELVHLVSQLT